MKLWRRVFHEYWWVLGWHGSLNGRRGVTWSLCLSEINLPRVRWELRDPDGGFICLDWGNGNSDPVWSIGVQW